MERCGNQPIKAILIARALPRGDVEHVCKALIRKNVDLVQLPKKSLSEAKWYNAIKLFCERGKIAEAKGGSVTTDGHFYELHVFFYGGATIMRTNAIQTKQRM